MFCLPDEGGAAADGVAAAQTDSAALVGNRCAAVGLSAKAGAAAFDTALDAAVEFDFGGGGKGGKKDYGAQ